MEQDIEKLIREIEGIVRKQTLALLLKEHRSGLTIEEHIKLIVYDAILDILTALEKRHSKGGDSAK